MSDKNQKQSAADVTMSSKQLVGAAIGAVALIGLLIIGRTFSGTKEAEILVNAETPVVSAYETEAVELDPFAAAGNEYEIGQMVTLEADLSEPLGEPVLGAANVVVEMSNATVQSQSDKAVPVVLVFSDETMVGEADQLVMGRYIGAVEVETALGGTTPAPAIQVDYVESL